MKEWFLSRAPRERVTLAAGAALAVLIVFWGYVFTPLRDGSAELRESVGAKTGLLVDVQRAAAITPTEGAPQAGEQSLVVLIDSTAQSHGLAGTLTRTRPEGSDVIHVTFQNASFDALLGWLVALAAEHRMSVESATVSSTRTTGLVNGQISLRRS